MGFVGLFVGRGLFSFGFVGFFITLLFKWSTSQIQDQDLSKCSSLKTYFGSCHLLLKHFKIKFSNFSAQGKVKFELSQSHEKQIEYNPKITILAMYGQHEQI